MNLKELKYEDFINEIKLENRDLTHENGYEIHHILPKALGGTNDPSNLVKLTYFEHLVAHYLIAKEARCYEMYRAFTFLMNTNFQNFSGTEFNKLTEEDLREIAEMKALALEKRAEAQRLPEYREKVSKSVKEYFDNNPEAKEHQSRIHKEFYEKNKDNPEYMAKLANTKGKKCYNNGISDILIGENEEVPEGYYPGSVKKGKKNWWTKGEVSIFSEECPGEGYVPGKFSEIRVQKEKDLKENQDNASTLIDELKYKVDVPLSNLRKNLKRGKITEEEVSIKEKEIYRLREEILHKYGR